MYGEQIARMRKALDPEAWNWPVNFWFMFDNHTFQRLAGTPNEMGDQIKRYMARDKYCGMVFARRDKTEKEVPELAFHGDYRDHAKTDAKIAEWVEIAKKYV